MSESLKQKSMKGIIWSFLNRSSVQVAHFVVTLILARLLSPEDYGVVGLAIVTIALVECFSDLGLGSAIIQKKEVDELDYSTFFWSDLVMRATIYGIAFFSAGYIADYYGKPELANIIRVIGLTVPGELIGAVPKLKLTRELNFRMMAWINVISCVISCVVALILAFRGYGVWALAWQQTIMSLGTAVLMQFVLPWRPHWKFSRERFRQFFTFGSKFLFSRILDTVWGNVNSAVIGKAFTISDLGYYSKGIQLSRLVEGSVNTPITKVAFPMMSKLQDDPNKVREALRKALRTSLFFVAPMMAGLAVTAKPMLVLLFGEKWLPSVPFMLISTVIYLTSPIHTLNLNVIMGLGRSDIFLKLEILKKVIGIIIMVSFLPFGLTLFASSKILSTAIAICINTFPLKKLIGYSTIEQLKDIGVTILGSVVMFALLFPMNYLPLNQYLIMGIQIVLGIPIYLIYSWLFTRKLLIENIQLLKQIVIKKKHS